MTIEKLLKNSGHTALLPLQEATITSFKTNSHVQLLAQTGSGKTLAYLLAQCEHLNVNTQEVQTLILSPTRELALQISEVFKSLQTGLHCVTCYGGHSVQVEKNELEANPSVIVATPGRILDHLKRNHLDISKCRSVVIDEFDKCLEFGFEKEMNAIRSFLPVQVNTLLVSATRITYLPEAWSSDNYDVLQFQSDDKPVHLKTYKVSCLDIYEELKYCLSAFKNEPSVIFCNYREVAENLSNRLKDEGFTYTLYHGGLTQAERELALVKFKNGSVLSLVCTDLGARGLDISAVKHVVHYQLPDSEATFTHRNGRTARAEQEGNAYIFVKEAYDLPDYLSAVQDTFVPPREVYPVSPQWTTLYFNAGKKDKLRKLDIVGFLTQQGHLKPEEIGRIDLMDFHAYVAIRYDKLKATLPMIKEKRIKRKRIVIKKAK